MHTHTDGVGHRPARQEARCPAVTEHNTRRCEEIEMRHEAEADNYPQDLYSVVYYLDCPCGASQDPQDCFLFLHSKGGRNQDDNMCLFVMFRLPCWRVFYFIDNYPRLHSFSRHAVVLLLCHMSMVQLNNSCLCVTHVRLPYQSQGRSTLWVHPCNRAPCTC